MSQSKFNIKVGDNVVFLGKTDSAFVKNGKYKILAINIPGEYPFNEPHYLDLTKDLKNPIIITIKEKNNNTFYLIHTNKGFYHDDEKNWSYKCNYNTFDIERRLRKEKLKKINKQ